MKKIVIIGGKGTAVVIAEHIYDAVSRYGADYEILGFAFDEPELREINGWPVLCGTRQAYTKFKEDKEVGFIFALYRSDIIKERATLRDSYGIPKERFFTFIHPSVFVAKSACVGNGSIILANSVINSNSILGDFTYLMANVLVGHDTTLGESNFVAAHCCIGSNLKIGSYNFFGLNSNYKNFIRIGDNNIVGMGTNLLSDLSDNSVAVGNPGKIIKTRD